VGNNNKMTKNDVRMIWVYKRFGTFGSFHFGLVFIFGRFSCRRYCGLGTCKFLTVLMENNNKMTKNDGQMVWVQIKVIMC